MNKTKPVFVVFVMTMFLALGCLPAGNCTSYNYASSYYPANSIAYPSYPEVNPQTAQISNLGGIRYAPDGSAAYLHVQEVRDWPAHSDEAFVVAGMSGPCQGDVWIYALANAGHVPSRLFVCVSNSPSTPFGEWMWIGEVYLYQTYSQWLYVGYSYDCFNYIAFCLISNNSYPPIHNGVYIDSVRSIPHNPEVYVPAVDNYNDPVSATVYVDGNPVGSTGSTYSVSPGCHTVGVSVPSGYTFSHFVYDGDVYTSNPISKNFLWDHTLKAYYTKNDPPPTHQLGVLSVDQTAYPVSVPLYIDSEYVGYTGNSYTVSHGSHTLSVPSSYGNYYFNCWYIDGYLVYTSTVNVNIDYDKVYYAYYIYY